MRSIKIRTMMVALTTALATLLICASPASAQVFQCRDANGKVRYADAPCASNEQARVVEQQRSPEEIQQERAQANEALERKYRENQARREQQRLDIQTEQARAPAMPANPANSLQCRQAQKDMEFASAIRTLSDGERRVRINAEIAKMNAACGTNTPLMQEPARVNGRHHPHNYWTR